MIRICTSLTTAVVGLFSVLSGHALAADNFSTYGALSVFGRNQSVTTCLSASSVASARLAIAGKRGFGPTFISMQEATNSLKFVFGAESQPEFAAAPPPPLIALEVWRTYLSFPAGTWDFVSTQKLTNGERVSDAIRLTIPGVRCVRLTSVGVLDGDMQVSTAGQPFAIPNVRVEVRALETPFAANASVVLASEVIVLESTDTGIDGPTTALLTDASGHVDLPITPGTKPGIKRFIVKARDQGFVGAVSAMVTLAHAPVGAPVQNSVPIVEYAYDGGVGARPSYLTGNAGVTRLLDASDGNLIARTGQVWRAFTALDAAPGLAPVCQFFGHPTSGVAVTHFFTANAQECAQLRAARAPGGDAASGLAYEGIAFYAVTPDAQQRCPSAYPIPIVRYFDPAPSPHHIYLVAHEQTTVTIFGPPASAVRDGVVFCTDVATSI